MEHTIVNHEIELNSSNLKMEGLRVIIENMPGLTTEAYDNACELIDLIIDPLAKSDTAEQCDPAVIRQTMHSALGEVLDRPEIMLSTIAAFKEMRDMEDRARRDTEWSPWSSLQTGQTTEDGRHLPTGKFKVDRRAIADDDEHTQTAQVAAHNNKEIGPTRPLVDARPKAIDLDALSTKRDELRTPSEMRLLQTAEKLQSPQKRTADFLGVSEILDKDLSIEDAYAQVAIRMAAMKQELREQGIENPELSEIIVTESDDIDALNDETIDVILAEFEHVASQLSPTRLQELSQELDNRIYQIVDSIKACAAEHNITRMKAAKIATALIMTGTLLAGATTPKSDDASRAEAPSAHTTDLAIKGAPAKVAKELQFVAALTGVSDKQIAIANPDTVAVSPTGGLEVHNISSASTYTYVIPSAPEASHASAASVATPESTTTTTTPVPTTTTTEPTPATTTTLAPATVGPEGYPIPAETTPTGFDQWNVSSNILSKSGFSGADYNFMVAGTGLAGVGDAIYQAEQTTGINGLFILSHMAIESAWGESNFAKTRDNFWGLGAYTDDPDHAYYFQSVQQCLDYYTNLLQKYYLSPGDTYYGGGTTVHDIFIHYSTSDTPENEITGQAEDEGIVRTINTFLTKAQQAGLQPAGTTPLAPAPQPAPTTTTTEPPQTSSSPSSETAPNQSSSNSTTPSASEAQSRRSLPTGRPSQPTGVRRFTS